MNVWQLVLGVLFLVLAAAYLLVPERVLGGARGFSRRRRAIIAVLFLLTGSLSVIRALT